MDEKIQELKDDLKSDDKNTARYAAIDLATIGQAERIELAIEELQSLVRQGPGKLPRAALSALARYGGEIDQSVVHEVEDHLIEYLETGRSNKLNGLIAVTAIPDDDFLEAVEPLTEEDDNLVAPAASLAYLKITDSDFDWLPIEPGHIQWIASDGISGLQKENPVHLLYLLDSELPNNDCKVSARDKLLHQDKDAETASSIVRFINEYPAERVSSLHISVLSSVAEDSPKTVIDRLDAPETKLRNSSGQKRHQYLWTFASIAEQHPDEIDIGIIELAEEIANSGKQKEKKQAERILSATADQDRTNVSLDNGSSDLLERAREASQENPVREQVTSTSSRYQRATPVKEYAKDRADGDCEYCGRPAPFKDASGEPYLEVHHVDELGEGGADKPERVVALCPTCHRRIHYGEDGEKVNRQLKKELVSKFDH